MSKLRILFPLLITLMLISCKNDKTETREPEVETIVDEQGNVLAEKKNYEIKNPDKLTIIRNMHINISPEMITDMVNVAKSELKKRWVASNKTSHISLDQDLYEYERVHDGNEMSEPGDYDGYWLDFEEDLTYSYGYKNEVQGKGTYDYNVEKSDILMVDDDPKIKPRNYEVKMGGEVLIVVGRPKYKDNNFQCKLKKVQNRPQ